jgi:hypothetical protein
MDGRACFSPRSRARLALAWGALSVPATAAAISIALNREISRPATGSHQAPISRIGTTAASRILSQWPRNIQQLQSLVTQDPVPSASWFSRVDGHAQNELDDLGQVLGVALP